MLWKQNYFKWTVWHTDHCILHIICQGGIHNGGKKNMTFNSKGMQETNKNLNCCRICFSALQNSLLSWTTAGGWRDGESLNSGTVFIATWARSSSIHNPECDRDRKLFCWYAKQHGSSFHVTVVTLPLFCTDVMINRAHHNKRHNPCCNGNRMCVVWRACVYFSWAMQGRPGPMITGCGSLVITTGTAARYKAYSLRCILQ